jgi:hypothetical protein
MNQIILKVTNYIFFPIQLNQNRSDLDHIQVKLPYCFFPFYVNYIRMQPVKSHAPELLERASVCGKLQTLSRWWRGRRRCWSPRGCYCSGCWSGSARCPWKEGGGVSMNCWQHFSKVKFPCLGPYWSCTWRPRFFFTCLFSRLQAPGSRLLPPRPLHPWTLWL